MGTWKIRELARKTGVSVRALRHYGALGLLQPGARTAAGYRLYDDDDVARLLRIVALKQLGLSLPEIRDCLAGAGMTLQRTLELHAQGLRERIRQETRLLRRLEGINRRLAASTQPGAAAPAEGVSADELLQLIEATLMFEKHYTQDQLRQLQARRARLGEGHVREVEAEWPRLIASVRECMARGVDPATAEVRPLAQRWRELVREFTGGDAGIARAAAQVYAREPSARQRTGLDPEIMAYVGRAMSAIGGWEGGAG